MTKRFYRRRHIYHPRKIPPPHYHIDDDIFPTKRDYVIIEGWWSRNYNRIKKLIWRKSDDEYVTFRGFKMKKDIKEKLMKSLNNAD